MTTILPTLELKYNKEITSSSINTKISTNTIVKKSDTPENISEFKEAFMAVLISYLKIILFF
jgi:hypothetical protein